MTSKLCPTKKHCFDKGTCETCEFGKVFKRLDAKIKRLEIKNGALRAENKELKKRIENITFPDF